MSVIPSDSNGQWYGTILSEENKKQFLIPKGFAHGFLVLSETAEFCYKCDASTIRMMKVVLLGMTLKSVLSGLML